MSDEPSSPDEILSRAVEGLRTFPEPRGMRETCVAAMLDAKPRSLILRRRLTWSVPLGATAVAAVACALLFGSRQASALEMLRRTLDAQDPNLLQHSKTYVVQPDGKLGFVSEEYAMRDRWRFIEPNGFGRLRANGDLWEFLPGQATVRHHYPLRELSNAVSLKSMLPVDEAATVSLNRDSKLEGKRVYRYEIERRGPDVVLAQVTLGKDGRPHERIVPETMGRDGLMRSTIVGGGNFRYLPRTRAYTEVLFVDPATQRPLRLETETAGESKSIRIWDYPAYSPGIFKPHIPPGTRVIDEGDFLESMTKLKGAKWGGTFRLGGGASPPGGPKPSVLPKSARNGR